MENFDLTVDELGSLFDMASKYKELVETLSLLPRAMRKSAEEDAVAAVEGIVEDAKALYNDSVRDWVEDQSEEFQRAYAYLCTRVDEAKGA